MKRPRKPRPTLLQRIRALESGQGIMRSVDKNMVRILSSQVGELRAAVIRSNTDNIKLLDRVNRLEQHCFGIDARMGFHTSISWDDIYAAQLLRERENG